MTGRRVESGEPQTRAGSDTEGVAQVRSPVHDDRAPRNRSLEAIRPADAAFQAA
jgi:hypothetical protein